MALAYGRCMYNDCPKCSHMNEGHTTVEVEDEKWPPGTDVTLCAKPECVCATLRPALGEPVHPDYLVDGVLPDMNRDEVRRAKVTGLGHV